MADSLIVDEVLVQYDNRLFSELGSHKCSEASSPFDRLDFHSARVQALHILPTRAAFSLLELFLMV